MADRVLVTAGASGIGLAVARRFAAAGARVLVCDVDEKALAALAGTGIDAVCADVADPAAVNDLFESVGARLGGIDVLVNNAGIGGSRSPLEEVGVDEWRRVVDVNLSGAFWCLQHAARAMKAQGSGCVINISTVNARIGLPLRTPYVATKAALLGLTLNAARELGPYQVRCNAILPGIVDNPRGRGLIERHAREDGVDYDTAAGRVLGFVSMRTLIEPDEIGDLSVFLASPQARHITGQCIGVCGNVEWES